MIADELRAALAQYGHPDWSAKEFLARLHALADRVEAVERDAARYSWLRKFWIVAEYLDADGHPLEKPKIVLAASAEILDEFIDDALKELIK